MIRCPHCEQPGISPLRKAILSPGISAVCAVCKKPSSISYPSWLTAMLPGSVLMVAALLVQSQRLEWTLNTVGFLLMIVIPLLFSPLRKQQ
ncbi:MAG: hypothetical protein WCH04_03360 [Gammaproteobacteria bacterium]